MQEKQITFINLEPNISSALKEVCPTRDRLIYKIADEVHNIQTITIEPGVEIARGLSTIIDTTIKYSIRSGCDISVVSQGILVGAFRSNRAIQLEAHKTIRLLVQEIVQSVFNHKGDIKKAVDGLLAGIVSAAKEHKLNVEESLIVAKEDVLLAAQTISPKFADYVKASLAGQL